MRLTLISKISIVILVVCLGLYLYLNLHRYNFKLYTEDELINICNKSNMIKTIKCMNSFQREIYTYNLTDDRINLTFEQLKGRGGDCRDWSMWNQKILSSLGYNTNLLSFPLKPWINYGKNASGHMLLEVNDNVSMCYIDGINYWCFYHG